MNRKGFTLLETLIAMTILAMGLMLLTNSWSGAFARIKKSQLTFEATSLIERKMNEIERKYRGKSLDEIPDEEGEDFEDAPNYAWKMSSKKLEFPDLSPMMTAREGGADQYLTMIMSKLSEHFGKTIKEVTVTIIYKQPKRNIEYSVTTYFVDYNKAIAL